MLVLTRKSEEKIIIGKQKKIIITILKIQGDKVSIGIEAPQDEPIYRDELLNKQSRTCRDQAKKEGIMVKELQIDLQTPAEQQKAPDVAPVA